MQSKGGRRRVREEEGESKLDGGGGKSNNVRTGRTRTGGSNNDTNTRMKAIKTQGARKCCTGGTE